jgi:Protein kinase domain
VTQLRCPSCGSLADDTGDTCPSCKTPLPWNDGETRLAPQDGDVTRLSTPEAERPASFSRTPARGRTRAYPKSVTSSSGWAGTTSDIDHGRFEPGAIFDERYRIIGRLGKGGMGDVYRADDLKLGQPVALKFLPESVDRDPARLTQLHTEVRMARQVSHPNVCRVYDVGEYDGHTFLSMEYVDGEDLASLLRRIGRFPQDRALELARQICAGLAAAHDRNVVHRDLKPANIMLDGSGRIRITDFGLAGAAGETLRAGTPAYMAPEQLAGGEVTPRSDIYALGLVLYEIFTGQRALDAKTMAELIAKREQAEITPPTAIVRDLDEAIERAILRCLDPNPAARPSSALMVAAALPGGDPLAAALAAGQTPSPEMVAAAGTAGAVSTRTAVAAAAGMVLASLAVLLLYQHVLMINRAPLPKPPDALIDRAQEIVQKLGYGDNVASTAAGLGTSLDWANYVERTSTARDRWQALNRTRPETYILWYRTSPRTLVPLGDANRVEGLNPPLNTSGMTLVVVDSMGRLAEFLAVPMPLQPGAPATMDWRKLFDAAGLDMSAFQPTAPRWVPSVFADERMAWEGRVPEVPDQVVRVEAAAAFGRPVSFGITGPWTLSARTPAAAPGTLFDRVTNAITALVMPALMLVGALLARRNVKLGRGDRRGAFRAASAVFLLLIAAWLLGDTHVGSFPQEIRRFFATVANALFSAGVLWLTYLGLEPYVRRFSADSLIGWTRLIAGRWRDPRVGRDVTVGVGIGLAMTLVFALHNVLPTLAGRPEPMPVTGDPNVLLSLRSAIAALFNQIQNGMTSGMLGIGGFVALRILLKRRDLAAVAAVICYVGVVLQGMFTPGYPSLDLALGLLITATFVLVVGWGGLLATVAALSTHFILLRAPLTADTSSWRFPTTVIMLGAVLAMGIASAAIASGRLQPRGGAATLP